MKIKFIFPNCEGNFERKKQQIKQTNKQNNINNKKQPPPPAPPEDLMKQTWNKMKMTYSIKCG